MLPKVEGVKEFMPETVIDVGYLPPEPSMVEYMRRAEFGQVSSFS